MTKVWQDFKAAEKAELVKPLALEGLSASQIAHRLSIDYGKVTRAAVIGVCHRGEIELGNRGRPKRSGKKPVSVSTQKRAQAPSKPKAPRRACTGEWRDPESNKPKEPVSVAPISVKPDDGGTVVQIREPEEEQVFQSVTLMELTARHCRWPMWSHSESAEGGLFCGKPRAHGAFCVEHGRAAYVAPELRRRKA